MIQYLCFSTDPQQPVVYLSATFDLPDDGSVPDRFITYERAKINFQMHLLNTYTYLGAEGSVECSYTNAATAAERAAATAGKKRTVAADAVAAKKQVVETGWKFVETASTAVASTGGTAGGRAGAPQAASSASGTSGPLFQWHIEKKTDALTDEVTSQPAAFKIVAGANGKPQGMVSVRAYCSSNGVSVFFQVDAGDNDAKPSFPWYGDSTRGDDAQIADVRLRVDSRPVHVAQGFPEVDGHQMYTNTLGFLFYEPHTAERAVRDQQSRASTGIAAVDGLLGGIVKQTAESTVQDWQSSAAGPLSDLVTAHSIRIELPVTTFDPKPLVDLNPQDPVLHQFVGECNAKFNH